MKQELMKVTSPDHIHPLLSRPRSNTVFYSDGLGHVSPEEKATLFLLIISENIQTKIKAFMLPYRIHIY